MDEILKRLFETLGPDHRVRRLLMEGNALVATTRRSELPDYSFEGYH